MAAAKKKPIKKTPAKSKKPTKSTSVVTEKAIAPTNPKMSQELKLSESYVSLVLGAAVVIVIFVFVFIFAREFRKPVEAPQALNESISPVLSRSPEKIHIMLENESLWDVAVKYYGDGFKYIEIVKVNKLENPDFVPPGTRIIIPD